MDKETLWIEGGRVVLESEVEVGVEMKGSGGLLPPLGTMRIRWTAPVEEAVKGWSANWSDEARNEREPCLYWNHRRPKLVHS
jgi:hypothetical protein